MKTMQDIARSYLGTPWRHQGRCPGAGLDCLGVVVCAAREMGREVHDEIDYSRHPHPDRLIDGLERYCVRVPLEEMQPGDILLFTVDGYPTHLGVVSRTKENDVRFIHAFMRGKTDGSDGLVVEVSLDRFWSRRVHSLWRLGEE